MSRGYPRYLDELADATRAWQIDAAVMAVGTDESNADAAATGRAFLAADDEW